MDQNGNAGGSPSGGEDGPRHRRNAQTDPSGSASTGQYTSEQLEAVKRVRKCQDYYEILGDYHYKHGLLPLDFASQTRNL